MKRISKVFNHSLKMVKYNIKSYRLLSVTVVLSFSFLLAFFVFSDSNIYNNFKEVFKLPDNLQFVTYRNDEKAKLFTENLDKMYDTYYYYYFQNNARFTNYDREDSQIIGFFSMCQWIRAIYFYLMVNIVKLN